MTNKLTTTERTKEIFDYIYQREYLPPYILAKISLALAINSEYKFSGQSVGDTKGLELQRQTITSDYDMLFKTLIEIREEKYMPEEEYFPQYVKCYLDEGAILLEQEYRYSNSDFYTHLVSLEKGI